MDHEHFRQIIKDADDDLKDIQTRVQRARDRLAAADLKYRERMGAPATCKGSHL